MSVHEYDIVFAGGGAAGCLIAGRLAAADPSLKILILESGEHTKDRAEHVQPARYFSHLAPTSKTVTFNAGKPSAAVGGRSIITPSGRCLGGGSSVNFTMYTRAAASDYDDWQTTYGNSGWGSKDLIPLLRKTETYQVETPEESPVHGYSGPLKVSMGGAYTNVGKEFLDVAAKYDKARGSLEDVNGLYDCNGYGRWQKWIDGETGRRSDVPHHFIYTQESNKNLVVETAKRVTRVIFEGHKAVGVEFVNDCVIDPDSDQSLRTARASKLVVVSAGAFGSPTILERSGIGGAAVLNNAGVETIVDLPGVGENYQDHNVCFIPYLASEEADTLDALFRGNKEENDKWMQIWSHEGKGLIAHNALDSGIKLRPSQSELENIGPAFTGQWNSYFKDAPDKPVIWMGVVSTYLGDPSSAPSRKYYSIGYYNEYPLSRGHVHINSMDPHGSIDFDPAFLTQESDLSTLNWGYKRSREFARRMAFYRGDFLPGHPCFSGENNEALCKETSEPVAVDAPDIKYSPDDDRQIAEFNQSFVQTAWHSLGTCAMKSKESGGVVDSKLNVYGTQNLKVADISIAPANVGANTYSTALVIAEKATMIIAEELGIRGV